MTEIPPPAEFNATVFQDELGDGRWRFIVHCWGHEVARIVCEPSTDPDRNWIRVVHRWARMVASREYRRWLVGGR